MTAGRLPAATARSSGSRRKAPAKHRVRRRRTTLGNSQLIGVTAALAATAGAASIGAGRFQAARPAAAAVQAAAARAAAGDSQIPAIALARLERRERGSRDASRPPAPDGSSERLSAARRLAALRAAKLDAYRAQTQRRAAALAAAKAAAEHAEAARRAAADAVRLPVSGYRITAVFGQAGNRWARDHTGTDFAAPIGTRIGAVMAGTIISAGWAGPYGKQVKIRHADGTETWYNHMSRITVSVGDKVAAGEQIGAVGSTGNSTGPHLHLEVHPGGGAAVDPVRWLRAHGQTP
ncbi:MAG: M23 family metallopeptidase [Catenulispora sp.]|nr:M23 family metallopeptidase [Catenulispora sp.]